MTSLASIEGIGPAYAEKLKGAGVKNAGLLLEKGKTPEGRREIAEKSGIADKMILQWINHVDLFRIKGVASEYADLLEAAGVDTVPELAQRKPENLLEKMAAVNSEKKLVRRLPLLAQVKDWVEQAKQLPRIITY